MRTFKIALAAVAVAAGLAVALTLPAARASGAEAVAVRAGRALVIASSGRVLRSIAPGGAVGAAAISPDGEQVTLSVGSPAPGGPDGVLGDIVVVDARSGDTRLRARLGSHVGGIAWGPGDRIAFVKDWHELWLLDPRTGRLRMVADGRAFARSASGAAGLLFDPAFTPDGHALVVGRVEETFSGEDDALDDLWRVDLEGRATRLTSFDRPAGGWRIARRPIPLPDGRTLFTSAASDGGWQVAGWRDGAVRRLVSLTPGSLLGGTRAEDVYLLVADPDGGTFDLVRTSSAGSRTVLRGISAFDLPDAVPEVAPPGPAGSSATDDASLADRIARLLAPLVETPGR